MPPCHWCCLPDRHRRCHWIAEFVMAYTDALGNRIGVYSLGIAPAVSLAAKSATTSTPVVLDALTPRATAVMVVNSSAGVSAGSVALFGSLDGSAWFAL